MLIELIVNLWKTPKKTLEIMNVELIWVKNTLMHLAIFYLTKLEKILGYL